MSNELDELFDHMKQSAAYMDRQTNPFTGAPLPQPIVGQGSAVEPKVPPAPGQVNRNSG